MASLSKRFKSQKLMGEVIDPVDAPTYLGCEPLLSPVEYSFQGCMDDLGDFIKFDSGQRWPSKPK